MANEYSMADLLDFLSHAGERGLMPAATAQALAVAVRNVLNVLSEAEKADIRGLDMDATVKRFTNKRARDFNPSSLKEYGRRVRKAVDLYNQWLDNPTEFSVKTRTPSAQKKGRDVPVETPAPAPTASNADLDVAIPTSSRGGYQSAFPVRPGRVVTLINIPEDLTSTEAERLALFIRMLAVH